MPKTKDRFQAIHEYAYDLFARLSVRANVGRSHLCSEAKRLVNGKRWKVNVVLVAVQDIAAVMILDISGRERIVVNCSFHGTILVALVGECLQQSATA